MSEYKVLSVGLGGITGYKSANSRTSIPDCRLERYLADVVEGGIVVDKRAILESGSEEAYRWVFRGPMVNPDLPVGEVSKCPTPGRILHDALVSGDMGQFSTVYAGCMDVGGLDHVDAHTYAAGWDKVGARIGMRTGNHVVWNDGTRTEV